MTDQVPKSPLPPAQAGKFGRHRYLFKSKIAAALTVAGFGVFALFFYHHLFSFYMIVPLVIALVGFKLSHIAQDEIKRSGGRLKGNGLAIATNVFSGLLAVISVWAAVADLPSYLKFLDKARQMEAKVNLMSVVATREKFVQRNRRGPNSFMELGWKPDGEIRYSYFIMDDSFNPLEQSFGLPEEVKAGLMSGKYLAAAACNVDDDPVLDVWVIAPGGYPANLIDDVHHQP